MADLDPVEALKIVSRVKAGTSNPDVLAVCVIAEKSLVEPKKGYGMSKPSRAEYMRDYRARKKGAGKELVGNPYKETTTFADRKAERVAKAKEIISSGPKKATDETQIGDSDGNPFIV